jgi:hypothetical protein
MNDLDFLPEFIVLFVGQIFIGMLFGNWFKTAEYFEAGGKDPTIPKALIKSGQSP